MPPEAQTSHPGHATVAGAHFQLGPYQLLRTLGEGGMGAVYEAIHVVIGRRVAIKTLGRLYGTVAGAAGRFLREAQITSRLRHPHIVDVTDLGFEDGVCFLVMEYLEGEDLDTRLRRGRLTVDETVEIVLPVIAAVATAHENGIVHRDLKPHNVFLTRSAGGSVHPKVLDFGIAKNLRGAAGAVSITGTGGFLGTPCYLAPEQLEQDKGPVLATNQYALGVMLYECLTGKPPFSGDDLGEMFHNILTGTCTPLAQVRPDLPVALQQVVMRAMSRDAEARFDSVKDLGRALLAFASPKVRLNWEPVFFRSGPARVRPFGRTFDRTERRRGIAAHWSPWVGLAIAAFTAFSTAALGIALLPEERQPASPAPIVRPATR